MVHIDIREVEQSDLHQSWVGRGPVLKHPLTGEQAMATVRLDEATAKTIRKTLLNRSSMPLQVEEDDVVAAVYIPSDQ